MPYRVFPDGTIETDTVDEMLGVVKAIELDSILGAKYSSLVKGSTEEFLHITDTIVNLVQEKGRIEAEIEVLLQRQKELVGKKSKPPATEKKSRTPKVELLSNPPELVPGYYAVIGREILQADGVSYFGDRLVVYKWGCSDPNDLAKEACNGSDVLLDLFGELSVVPLTKDHVEIFKTSREPVFYCSDFGIERPQGQR